MTVHPPDRPGSASGPGEFRVPPGELRVPPGEFRVPPGELRVSPGELRVSPGESRVLDRSDGPGFAVAVSPHLDDAVFSAGGTLAALAAAGWRVRVVTCFTASVADPSPFALSTQLDKGLSADVDYMALRRDEDRAALAVLAAPAGRVEPVHLPLPEAPHRGYTSAPDLFAGRHADDDVAAPLAAALAPHLEGADLVLAPQAIGDHVDHRAVVEVVAGLAPDALFWRDAPYVLRRPDAPPWHAVPAGREHPVPIAPHLDTKAGAARCYTTQLGFQFGGADRVAGDLTDLARAEARRVGTSVPCEVLRGPAPVPLASRC